MRTIIKRSVTPIFCLMLSSCSNALYFYETDKISLSLDIRPDSTQPVQGNLGIKQRVALITPPKNSDGGEALSSISSFRFSLKPGSFLDLGPVSIKTAFITGDAAADLTPEETVAATAFVSQASFDLSSDTRKILKNWIKTQGNREALKGWLDEEGIDASPTLFIHGKRFEQQRQKAINDLINSHPASAGNTDFIDPGSPVPTANIFSGTESERVLRNWVKTQGNREKLNKWLNKQRIDASPTTFITSTLFEDQRHQAINELINFSTEQPGNSSQNDTDPIVKDSVISSDHESKRVLKEWIKSNGNRTQLIEWLDKHGINVSVTLFINGSEFIDQRRQAIDDLITSRDRIDESSENSNTLKQWIKNPDHRVRLTEWLASNGIEVSVTSFIYGSRFAAERKQAIEELVDVR